jgi:hypothetical protein
MVLQQRIGRLSSKWHNRCFVLPVHVHDTEYDMNIERYAWLIVIVVAGLLGIGSAHAQNGAYPSRPTGAEATMAATDRISGGGWLVPRFTFELSNRAALQHSA